MLANNFLDKFSWYVKEDNGLERLGRVIRILIRFRNNDCHNGQNPNSKHTSAILMILPRQASLLIIHLRWHHEILLGPGADKLLYLVMAFKNSSLEKEDHSSIAISEISSRILILTWWSCARLNIEWRVCQRLLISKHGWSLYLIASATGRFLFLIQFISF